MIFFFSEKVFTSLEKINEQLREQGQQLKRIEERQMRVASFGPGAQVEEAVDEEDCQIFCKSRGDLIALEQKLSENGLFKRRVVSFDIGKMHLLHCCLKKKKKIQVLSGE